MQAMGLCPKSKCKNGREKKLHIILPLKSANTYGNGQANHQILGNFTKDGMACSSVSLWHKSDNDDTCILIAQARLKAHGLRELNKPHGQHESKKPLSQTSSEDDVTQMGHYDTCPSTGFFNHSVPRHFEVLKPRSTTST